MHVTHTWAHINDRESCRCHKGFIATPGSSGMYKCYGVYVKMLMPCNTPEPPRCNCTNATAVTVDVTGTRCSRYRAGNEVEKWPCENEDEWAVFKQEWAIMFGRSA
nr:unnamed protein product [Callosobruchus analis]